MKKIFLFLIVILYSCVIIAQKKVLDPKFDAMLHDLLNHSVPEVLPEDIKDNNEIVFLDTRLKKEFNTSHIKNATWVGFESFNLKKVKDIPKNKKIVVYCTVGYRSEKITEKLVKAGYKNVSNLYGGIFEWVHNNQVVVNKKGITEEIHTYDESWSQWLTKGIKKY